MCSCALLKAQLAATTEESCLETELAVSIRCPFLTFSLSVFRDFSRELEKDDVLAEEELGQNVVV